MKKQAKFIGNVTKSMKYSSDSPTRFSMTGIARLKIAPAKRSEIFQALRYFILAIPLLLLLPNPSRAFTQVTLSSAAPQGIESTFIAATTNQFQASYFKNPLAANTYAIKIFGMNPNFNPPVTNAMLLSALVTVDTYTYVYGWAGGVSYQQTVEEGLVGSYGNLCNTATSFMLIQMTSPTWSKGTCEDVISTILNQLFQMSLSTYPVAGF